MLLTIGMPVYNSSTSIVSSIESVLAQDWGGTYEILIVDDGSTDETPEVLSLYDNDPRIRVIKHAENLGRPYARNTIVDEAQGEYLTWIDADDTWAPEKLSKQFDSLCKYSEDGERAISICPFEVRWEGKGRARFQKVEISGSDIANILDASIPAYLWTMLCRTDWYRSVGGFDVKLPRLQDTDITLRLLKFGCYFVPVDSERALITYNKSDSGKSGKVVFAAMQHIFKKHGLLFKRFGPGFYHHCRSMHHDLGLRHSRANLEIGRVLFHQTFRIYHRFMLKFDRYSFVLQHKGAQIMRPFIQHWLKQ